MLHSVTHIRRDPRVQGDDIIDASAVIAGGAKLVLNGGDGNVVFNFGDEQVTLMHETVAGLNAGDFLMA